LFEDPFEILAAYRHEEVCPVLCAIDKAVKKQRAYAAGYLAYEAAAGLDTACETKILQKLPLIWFGLFKKYKEIN